MQRDNGNQCDAAPPGSQGGPKGGTRMIVAGGGHGHVGAVVNQVVRNAIAHAADADGGIVSAGPAGVVIHVVIFRVVPRWRQRGAVTPGHKYASLAGLIDIAANHLTLAAAGEAHAGPATVAHDTSDHLAVVGILEGDRN